MKPFRILHLLRAPVGGLFRHVIDLASAQAAKGHEVGILADKSGGNALSDEMFAAVTPHLNLGLHRIPISRHPGIADAGAVRFARKLVGNLQINILHGHGAKGGAYARLAGLAYPRTMPAPKRFYTPHGGSLHYSPDTLSGRCYLGAERWMGRLTDGVIFESDFARQTYAEIIGPPSCPVRVIHNGLRDEDFVVHNPAADSADFLFIGELRQLKGIDLLLHALADLTILAAEDGTPAPTAVIVGGGPDQQEFKTLATDLKLTEQVHFAGVMPAHKAFRLGKYLVMPSRAESLPYIALETAAAEMPLIATHVGGMGEIVNGTDTTLVAPDDVNALACAMADALAHPRAAKARAKRLKQAISARFTAETMAKGVLDFYAAARF